MKTSLALGWSRSIYHVNKLWTVPAGCIHWRDNGWMIYFVILGLIYLLQYFSFFKQAAIMIIAKCLCNRRTWLSKGLQTIETLIRYWRISWEVVSSLLIKFYNIINYMINLFSSPFLLSCVLLFSIRSQHKIKDVLGLCGQILVAWKLQGGFCEKLLKLSPCPAEPMPADSKTDLPLA